MTFPSPFESKRRGGACIETSSQTAPVEEWNAADVAVFGDIMADVPIYPFDRLPQSGQFELEYTIAPQLGGYGANCAICLARLSQKVALIGRVGDDDLGEMLIRILDREGVDCRTVLCDSVSHTSVNLSFIRPSGERCGARDLGANACVVRDDVDFDRLEAAKVFYACGFHFLPRLTGENLRGLLSEARRLGKVTVLNPTVDAYGHGPEDMLGCLGEVDILRVSAEASGWLSGEKNPEKAAQSLRGVGARAVVITLGPEGHLVCEGDGGPVYGRAFDARVNDRAGAGSAFDAGLIAGFLQEFPLSECARWGAAAAAFSLRGPNAFQSVPGIEALRRSLRREAGGT